MTLSIFGYASDIAANRRGSAQAPAVLQASPYLQSIPCDLEWHVPFVKAPASNTIDKMTTTQQLCTELAQLTLAATQTHQRFLVLGGDHSCAIGTWSGVATALQQQKHKPLGLIWLDAHLDGHTPETSLSHNIHGMPLAALLGHGDPRLTEIMTKQAKIVPEHTVVIGARSFEPVELALFQRLGVTLFTMEMIQQDGLAQIFKNALDIATQDTAGFGVSLDLDCIDPTAVPAVNTPVSSGIDAKALLIHLPILLQSPHLAGTEIVEFNPSRDIKQQSEQFIAQLIQIICH